MSIDSTHIREDLVAYIWRTRQLPMDELTTTAGEALRIIKQGWVNTHAGPDIMQAEIELQNIRWYGNIEFHVLASDWSRHKHNDNQHYDNVILHVVWREDTPILNREGQRLPCLELGSRIAPAIVHKYLDLKSEGQEFVPCEKLVNTVSEGHLSMQLDTILVQKFEAKYQAISQLYTALQQDLHQLFFVYVARYFGLPSNQDTMEALASSLPYSILAANRHNRTMVEAILMGQANMLSGDSHYAQHLASEYRFAQEKYGLTPLAKNMWKFARMRPFSFPTLRISQLAHLICSEDTWSFITEKNVDLGVIRKNLGLLRSSSFWDDRYTFDGEQSAGTVEKKLGAQLVHLLLINAFIPLRYFYHRMHGEQDACEDTLELLRSLPAENNGVVRKWKGLGIKCGSAYLSQGLLYLKAAYCDKRRCTECRIGHQVMKA